MTPKIARNTPCPCGSTIKYKHCCRRTQDPLEPPHRPRPGTRVQCVTDWYAVRDREALVARLDWLPEAVGCAAHGWSRVSDERRFFEPLAALVFDEDDRLEVTTATEFAAETTRWWLERVAGDFVTYLDGAVQAQEEDWQANVAALPVSN